MTGSGRIAWLAILSITLVCVASLLLTADRRENAIVIYIAVTPVLLLLRLLVFRIPAIKNLGSSYHNGVIWAFLVYSGLFYLWATQ